MPKKIVMIGAAVLVLGAGGAVPVVMNRSHHTTGIKAKPKPVTVPLELDEFLVNLSDRTEQHYLKVTMVLDMVKSAKGEGGEGKTNPEMAPIRDAIITTMSRRSLAELLAPEGKQALKESIIRDVNRALVRDAVTEVYFTSFAMQ
jgi:flagellar FliL protein